MWLREPPALFRLTRFRLTSSIFAHSTMQLLSFLKRSSNATGIWIAGSPRYSSRSARLNSRCAVFGLERYWRMTRARWRATSVTADEVQANTRC